MRARSAASFSCSPDVCKLGLQETAGLVHGTIGSYRSARGLFEGFFRLFLRQDFHALQPWHLSLPALCEALLDFVNFLCGLLQHHLCCRGLTIFTQDDQNFVQGLLDFGSSVFHCRQLRLHCIRCSIHLLLESPDVVLKAGLRRLRNFLSLGELFISQLATTAHHHELLHLELGCIQLVCRLLQRLSGLNACLELLLEAFVRIDLLLCPGQLRLHVGELRKRSLPRLWCVLSRCRQLRVYLAAHITDLLLGFGGRCLDLLEG